MRDGTAWIIGILAMGAGCGPAGDDAPMGEVVWRTVGGYCEGGPCASTELRRDDGDLQLLSDGDATYGTWTDAGLAEYAAASAEAADASGAEPLPTCSPADGIDQQITLVDGDDTFTVTFCLGSAGATVAPRARDALFDELVGALTICEDTLLVHVDC